MTPPAWVEIDLGAIATNARVIRRHAPGRTLIAVVKHDAYGHGAPRVAQALKGIADQFAVATSGEGEELRRHGVRAPILVLVPAPHADRPRMRRLNLLPTVADLVDCSTAPVHHGVLLAHLKFDTGMGRLGLLPAQAREAVVRLRRRGVRAVAGTYTHLAAALEPGFTAAQLDRFDRCLGVLRTLGLDPGPAHVANSEAVLTGGRPLTYDAVRPGLILYGAGPKHLKQRLSLRPAMALVTCLASVRRVERGATISYAHTWRAPRPTRLGVLPIGYAGGYMRTLSNRGKVLVGGCRAKVRGRICMNLTVVDLARVPGARIGASAVLFGKQGGAHVPVEEVADRAGTIPYELLCLAGSLNPRIYRD